MSGIQTVGVCGAGVMGSQLAALFAGAGCRVLLYDLDSALAQRGLDKALAARPAAFFDPAQAENVTPLSYDQDLGRLAECDWVLEAIAERVDLKRSLYQRIAPVLSEEALLSSNTSGLAPEELAAALPKELRNRFLITHFFNPPRYLRLVEMVPVADTRPDAFERLAEFIGRSLGKGIVRAKPTPNFIANRIGIHGMMLALRLTRDFRMSVEEVDALTGPVMGRPKSATYRTADLVGLDVLAEVARTSYEQCPEDEARELFRQPPYLPELLERGRLGQKSGEGFYKKDGKMILGLDLATLEYRPKLKVRLDAIAVARRYTDLRRRLHALAYNPDPAGRFAWELVIGNLSYAAQRAAEVADDVVAVDRAMKWGFGWELGPFEAWDALGVEKAVRRMKREGKPVPPLVTQLLACGEESFHRRDATGRRLTLDLAGAGMQPLPTDPEVVDLADRRAAGGEILRNWSCSLLDLGDGVGCIEFHSALQPEFNPIDGAVIDLMRASLEKAQREGFRGLVLSHQGAHYCAGANLALILEVARAKRFDLLERVSKELQDVTQMIRYAPFPVVAAPFNLCLGGGYETVAPCRQIVALAELYCGAVEVGVGLIPGAGGTLRLLTHNSARFPMLRYGPMMAVQKTFETIAFAKVSRSAHEAKTLGYLREDNPIVLSRDHQIGLAKEMVLTLAENYLPPEPVELRLPGKGGKLAIRMAVAGYRKSGQVSEHDALVVEGLAHVLTGGSRANGIRKLDEQYLLDLEREVFVSLAGEPKSQERMQHMLKTGKPLRN